MIARMMIFSLKVLASPESSLLANRYVSSFEPVLFSRGAYYITANEKKAGKGLPIPEAAKSEYKLILGAVEDFMANEVFPHMDALEGGNKQPTIEFLEMFKDPKRVFGDATGGLLERLNEDSGGLLSGVLDDFLTQLGKEQHTRMIEVLCKLGELGLLGVSVPDAYQPEELKGSYIGPIGAGLLAIKLGGYASLFTTVGAHAGIGTYPLVLFGSEALKKALLPKMVTGEIISCYALTEQNAGSDAFAGRTVFVMEEGGDRYRVTGNKMFISNGGFAHYAVVFGRVEGRVSAFMVQLRGEDGELLPGVSIGKEMKKTGLWGSSTVELIFDGAHVPAANLLGEIGMGKKIGLLTLNFGRSQLGAGACGAMQYALDVTAHYVQERQQGGRPIAHYGAVREWTADMKVQAWVSEAAVWRGLSHIQSTFETVLLQDAEALARFSKTISPWSGIMKVGVTEALGEVVHKGAVLHGGYGFMREYDIERLLRDWIITEIYEGTNIINRLKSVQEVLARFLSDAALQSALQTVSLEVQALMDGKELYVEPSEEALGMEETWISGVEKLLIHLASLAVTTHGPQGLIEQQQVVLRLADLMIALYFMESAMLRARAVGGELEQDIARVYLHDTLHTAEKKGRELVNMLLEDASERDALHAVVDVWLSPPERTRYDIDVPKERIATAVLGPLPGQFAAVPA